MVTSLYLSPTIDDYVYRRFQGSSIDSGVLHKEFLHGWYTCGTATAQLNIGPIFSWNLCFKVFKLSTNLLNCVFRVFLGDEVVLFKTCGFFSILRSCGTAIN